LRIYVEKKEIPRVYGGMGIAILSTPKGVMTGRQAWHQGMGENSYVMCGKQIQEQIVCLE